MLMRKICSVCKADLGTVASSIHSEDVITHGICENCANTIMSQLPSRMQDFLDSLSEPVLVMDDDVVARLANKKAMEVLNKDLPRIQGFRGGDIIECIHASEPGGCGRTIHCSGCVIRNTVMDTCRTGKSHLEVPAYADIPVAGKPGKVRFLISTEKVKDMVLLRIDDVGSDNEPSK